ncbi:MAG: divergent polysaccharide deacetylase family protein [Elusimicrobia bacterium]|nr:divergent polysaccharide deacetylase family protein [Elusimicrobiota bacterium]
MKRFWRILIIVFITVAVVFYLHTKPKNLYKLSNKVDIKINSVLTSLGIGDENIIRHLRVEKKSETAKWIEVIKTIKTEEKIPDIITEIKAKLKEYGVLVEFDKNYNVLLVSKNGSILNKVFFSSLKPAKFKAIIIIDDLGYRKDELTDFLALGIPLTYAILPFEKNSSYIAGELKKNNQEYFLHQPMEPEGYPKVNPGKAAILLDMPKEKIEKMVLKNLRNVDGVIGVNNHMGSAFTKNEKKMKEFLNIVKQKNIIFVDSYTSHKSVAYKTAISMGIPALQNEVFLDNEDNLEYILKQLSLFKKLIKRNGNCVAIGHIQKKYLPEALSKIIPEFQKEDIEFLTVSEYIKNEPADLQAKNKSRTRVKPIGRY